jgi:drug/metabolite transporter (DMT)-like permease
MLSRPHRLVLNLCQRSEFTLEYGQRALRPLRSRRSSVLAVFMQSSSNLRGIIYMVLAGLTFVSCDSFLKLMLVDVLPMQSLVLRGISATVWCLGLLTIMGQLKDLPKALNRWTVLRSLAEVVAVTAFILALANVPLGVVTAIYQVAPLLVLVGASVIWGERVGLWRWLLIALGLAGALVVAQPGSAGASPFALLGFVTALASAARDLLTRKAPHNVPGLVVTFNVVVAVLIASFVNNQIFEGWQPVSTNAWLYSIGAGFFVMLGHFFVYMAFRHASARAVAPFYYAFTLVAVIFGAVFFKEFPNPLALVGIGMIVICGLGVLYFEQGEKTA